MLTQRQLSVLSLIIQLYTDTGIPVGSKTLMNAGIKASSATIRNDMMTLEEHGLLQKTHSSSGRVPSMKGYRFYVDHLLKPVTVSPNERVMIRRSFGKEFHAINDIIEQSATILSELTSYTAFSLGPEVKERRLTGFRMVPLNDHQVIAIIVTDKGNVESQVFSIPQSISSEDMEKMIRLINDKLVGQPLVSVYHKLRTEIPMILHKYFQTPSGIMELFDTAFGKAFEDRVFVSGEMNLLDFDVLNNLNEFKSVYSVINDKDSLQSLIGSTSHELNVKIGTELGNDLLHNMSLITATYTVTDHGKGTIALLGPANMSYSKIVGLVDAFRMELSTQLDDYYRSLDFF